MTFTSTGTGSPTSQVGDLYRLLRLANAELCYRWLPESNNNNAASKAALQGPADAATHAYTSLLLDLATSVAQRCVHAHDSGVTVDAISSANSANSAINASTQLQVQEAQAETVLLLVTEAAQEQAISARGVRFPLSLPLSLVPSLSFPLSLSLSLFLFLSLTHILTPLLSPTRAGTGHSGQERESVL
jgi:hypothetical protein